MKQRNAPVPDLLLEGADYFVTADAGMTLADLLRNANPLLLERIRASEAAAQALAGLHRCGFRHGRPHLRDICWDGRHIRFIDLERGASLQASRRQMARDLATFVFGLYTVHPHDTPEVAAACTAYRRADPGGIWDAATDWCRRWRWLEVVLAPAIRRERRKYPDKPFKEYQAIRPFLQRFLTDRAIGKPRSSPGNPCRP